MGRIEYFEHSNMKCCRKEVDGWPPVEMTVQHTLSYYSDPPVPREGRRWKGRHILILGDKEYDVDCSLLGDRGPKIGISVTMEEHREVPLTQAQWDSINQRVNEAAVAALVHAGIWKGGYS